MTYLSKRLLTLVVTSAIVLSGPAASWSSSIASADEPPTPSSLTVTADPVSSGATVTPLSDGEILGRYSSERGIAPGQSRTFDLATVDGFPTSATGVYVSVSVSGTSRPGYLAASGVGTPAATVSMLNYVTGHTVRNTMLVRLAPGSPRLVLRNASAGWATLMVDIVGFTSGGIATDPGRVTPLQGARLLDTRSTGGVVAPHAQRLVQVAGRAGVPTSGAGAVMVNLTVVAPTRSGWAALAAPESPAGSSSLNYVAGENRASMALVALDASGRLSVTNGSAGSSHYLLDVMGYVRSGSVGDSMGAVGVQNPMRVLDTRTQGGPVSSVVVGADRLAIPQNARAVIVTLTTVKPEASTELRYGYLSNDTESSAAFSEVEKGAVNGNLAIVPVADDGSLTLQTGGPKLHLVVDVLGFVTNTSFIEATVRSTSDEPLGDVKVGPGSGTWYGRTDANGGVRLVTPLSKILFGRIDWCAYPDHLPADADDPGYPSVCLKGGSANWAKLTPGAVMHADARLAKAVMVTGTVHDSQGETVTHGVVDVGWLGWCGPLRTGISPDGTFRVRGLEPGSYAVGIESATSASATPYGLAREWHEDQPYYDGACTPASGVANLTPDPGTGASVDLVADPAGQLAGSVVLADGSAAVGQSLSVETPAGRLVSRLYTRQGSTFSVALHSGTYVVRPTYGEPVTVKITEAQQTSVVVTAKPKP